MTYPTRDLRPKTYVLLFLDVLFGALGNTFFDKGMKDVGALGFGSASQILAEALRMATSRAMWGGVLFMVLFFVCHMLVLSWADYSFVLPFSAMSFGLVPLFAFLWLGEKVLTARWIGIGLIVAGVALVSRTPPSTTQPSMVEPSSERI
jgi:drug/metabolite transporter (DMT)-like permease